MVPKCMQTAEMALDWKHQLLVPVFGPSRPRLNPLEALRLEPVAIGTVTSRFLCSFSSQPCHPLAP